MLVGGREGWPWNVRGALGTVAQLAPEVPLGSDVW